MLDKTAFEGLLGKIDRGLRALPATAQVLSRALALHHLADAHLSRHGTVCLQAALTHVWTFADRALAKPCSAAMKLMLLQRLPCANVTLHIGSAWGRCLEQAAYVCHMPNKQLLPDGSAVSGGSTAGQVSGQAAGQGRHCFRAA